MPIRYPVKAELHEGRFGLFDNFGYWASFGGTIFRHYVANAPMR